MIIIHDKEQFTLGVLPPKKNSIFKDIVQKGGREVKITRFFNLNLLSIFMINFLVLRESHIIKPGIQET